ncbi:MAG: SAM-dependent chlorinase/fluorinase [Ignavibacteriales bacterium]|nr:SAM-dependent chlorinase/fluorinase [Ignavibacteriales bacterium]
MKNAPVIGLLTDFGTSDSYVASMKGVILSIAPHASIVDISHEIAPQNIDQAAYVLWSSYRFFPKKTIFICVIDPDVGTSRQILGVKNNEYIFIAPDNGVLKYVLGFIKKPKIIKLGKSKYFLNNVSDTFHGRDIFAPVAGYLASGLPIEKLGPSARPITRAESFIKLPNKSNKRCEGKIINIDRFGNLITNIFVGTEQLPSAELLIGKSRIKEYSNTYSNALSGKPFIITGSSGLLEVSAKNDNAAKLLHADGNSRVQLLIK